MHDRAEAPPGGGGKAFEQPCPNCQGALYLWLKLERVHQKDSAHRVYRCEACSHFEWLEEPPGKRT